MTTIDLANKRISILGLARSGRALAQVLTRRGAHVLVSDVKTAEQMEEVRQELADLPLEWELGGHTEKVYTDRDLIIISPGISIFSPIVQAAMAAGVPVISEVEMAFLLAKAPFIAITGTNGKSTTSTLIHETLLAAGKQSHLAGNIGIPLVGEVEKITEDAWITAEISSFQLEAVEWFRPRIAVLTNITTDHIDRHKTFEGYVQAKGNLFSRQTPDDFAVLNADDPAVLSLLSRIPSQKLFFSRRGPVEEGAWFEDGHIKTRYRGVEKTFFKWGNLPLQGVHNLENVMAVACVCLVLGLSSEALLAAVKTFEPLHFRMEYVDTVDGRRFYNDSKGTNPDAVRASLESFEEPVVIIAGGTDKGLDFVPLAENIRKFAVHAVLIGQSRQKIAQALDTVGFSDYSVIDDLRLEGFKAAMIRALEVCPDGGVVLLSPSCASFDMFRNAEHRGEMFNHYVGELRVEYERKKEEV